MPANGRWDLIRRLKVNGISKTVSVKHVLKIFSYRPKVERKFISGFLSAKPRISFSHV